MVRAAKSWASVGAIGLVPLLLGGCGGKVIVDGDNIAGPSTTGTTTGPVDPCATPSVPFNSSVALALAHCQPEIPATAQLLQMWSSGVGDVDSKGTSNVWRMTFRDDDGDHPRYHVDASPAGVDVKVGENDISCAGEVLDAFDSAAVMPDAIERFAAHDPYEGGKPNFFIFESAACLASDISPVGRGLHIRRADPKAQDGSAGWWFASYSGDNTFVDLCGPCKQNEGASCAPCFK